VIGKAPDVFRPRPYRPAWWLPGAHAQTVCGRLLRRAAPPAFRRERIELPDGDFVDLDHPQFAGGPGEDAPLVLLLHGLEGSARRGYAVNAYTHLAARGIRAAGLNFRSCSGEPNRTPRSYHSGATDDIAHVLRLLAERHPHVRRGVIGFSLGGNAMLKLLGELGEAAAGLVRGAVAVSVPYDLAAGADTLDASAVGRWYVGMFLKTMIAKIDAKAHLLDGRCDLERIRAARSFRDFDDAATAPLHGFDGAADYYARCSSRDFVHGIRVPTLLLHADDDPFVPPGSFPHEAVGANPWLQATVTASGGHVGFIEGQPWAPRFWAEEQGTDFLAELLLVDTPMARR
jgi:uncharacterized protein